MSDKYFCETCLMKFKKWAACRKHILENGHGKLNKEAINRLNIQNFSEEKRALNSYSENDTFEEASPGADGKAKARSEGFAFNPNASLDLGIANPSSLTAPVSTFSFSSNIPRSSPSHTSPPFQHPAWAIAEAEVFISMALRKPLGLTEIKRRAKKQTARQSSEYVIQIVKVMQSDTRIEEVNQGGVIIFTKSKKYSTSNDNPWTIALSSPDSGILHTQQKKEKQQQKFQQRQEQKQKQLQQQEKQQQLKMRLQQQQQMQQQQHHQQQRYQASQTRPPTQQYRQIVQLKSSQKTVVATEDVLALVPSYFDQVQRTYDVENHGEELSESESESESESGEEFLDVRSEDSIVSHIETTEEDGEGAESKKSRYNSEVLSGEQSNGEETNIFSKVSDESEDKTTAKQNKKIKSNGAKSDPALDEEAEEFTSEDFAIKKLMFGDPRDLKKATQKLERGFSLADRTSSRRFNESAYLGKIKGDPTSVSKQHGVSKPEMYSEKGGDCEVYLNTHEPFCIAAIGVQGAGKSHTMAVVLESCLLPCPYPKGQEIVRLHRPMTALVLHYDQNVTSICEATGLISAIPSLCQVFKSNPIALPRENMVVLVSPSYYLQRKKFYGNYCVVKPLLFSWANLTADHLKKIMRINEGDNQLYVASMLDLLRSYQRSAVVPEFQGFLSQVQEICSLKAQAAPLLQRISLLEAFVAESQANASIRSEGADLYSTLGPGCLVVADLTDPLLSSQEANGIFQVLTEQFRTVPAPEGCGKLLALDEAHKFMHGESTDGLSNAIVNAARLMRHDGMRVLVSSQSPKALAPELLELVSVAVLHRFHSRDWFDYLRLKIPLDLAMFDRVVDLTPGNAIVFAARHLVSSQLDLVMQIEVRQKLTADRGSSRTNLG